MQESAHTKHIKLTNDCRSRKPVNMHPPGTKNTYYKIYILTKINWLKKST